MAKKKLQMSQLAQHARGEASFLGEVLSGFAPEIQVEVLTQIVTRADPGALLEAFEAIHPDWDVKVTPPET